MESQLLIDKRFVVTRNETEDGPLSSLLRAEGAHVMVAPCVAHFPPWDPKPLEKEVREADTYQWIVFSSARGVDAFAHARSDQKLAVSPKSSVVCIGSTATARAEARGMDAIKTATSAGGEGVVKLLREFGDMSKMRVLHVAKEDSAEQVDECLTAAGIALTRVAAYRSTSNPNGAQQLGRLLETEVDAVIFCSPAACGALKSLPGVARALLQQRLLVSMGPATTTALKQQGFINPLEPKVRSFDGVVEALVKWFQSPDTQSLEDTNV